MVVLIFSGNEKNALKWKENFSLDKKRRFGANHGKFFLDYFVVNPLVPWCPREDLFDFKYEYVVETIFW